MDLFSNFSPSFTRWVVKNGHLKESFVFLDVGVQGGEQPRWAELGDHLIVHGFDAIEKVVNGLKANAKKNRHYHWLALSDEDGEREFFVCSDSFSSSFYPTTNDGRTVSGVMVPVRRLDTLFEQGLFPQPDAMKVDVEGFEKHVLLGASAVLRNLISLETETSFHYSPVYPDGHFMTMAKLAFDNGMVPMDLNFARYPWPAFQDALERRGFARITRSDWLGPPATINALFARDPIQEADVPSNYRFQPQPWSVDRLIKAIIVYELYGLNDVAVGIAERHRAVLAQRLDVDEAITLLIGTEVRNISLARPGSHIAAALPDISPAATGSGGEAAELSRVVAELRGVYSSTSWKITAPLRQLADRLRAWRG